MELPGSLNEQDVEDARTLVPAKGDQAWVQSWVFIGAVVIGLPTLVTYKILTGPAPANWMVIWILWLFTLGLAWLMVYSYKSAKARGVAKLKLPDRIDLSDDGIKMSKADGASTFRPWANVKSWREGRRVIVLMQSKTDVLTILPVADLSDAARQPIRDLLKAHVVASPGVP